MHIPITERSRKYGYLFWKKADDESVKTLLGNRHSIRVWLQDSFLGEKKIGWYFRRISLGSGRTRWLHGSLTTYELKLRKDGALSITCK